MCCLRLHGLINVLYILYSTVLFLVREQGASGTFLCGGGADMVPLSKSEVKMTAAKMCQHRLHTYTKAWENTVVLRIFVGKFVGRGQQIW